MLALLIVIIIVVPIWILNLPVFGKYPTGTRLEKIKRLPQYADGAIQNQSPTPALPEGISYWKIIRSIIKGNKNGSPKLELPHVKPDFTPAEEFKLIWFGHSSYLIQVDGLNILVDPVFSERPSPFQFMGTKRFKGTDFVQVKDFPPLDIVLITHDHYDHLDYHAILQLKDKTKNFITSLGVGQHLEKWGIDQSRITELSWGEVSQKFDQMSFKALPARHFSGRLFKRNQTLWSSFLLQTKKYKIYLGGDSGFDQHFKAIGEKEGPFDLAILECGQYNEMWPLIHLFPEQTAEAAKALKASKLMPVHWGKYKLALHDWNDSIIRVEKAANAYQLELVTPMLGETYLLKEKNKTTAWWLNL